MWRDATDSEAVVGFRVGCLGDFQVHAELLGFAVPHAQSAHGLIAFNDFQRVRGEVEGSPAEADVGGDDGVIARIGFDLVADDTKVLGGVHDVAFGDDGAGTGVEADFLGVDPRVVAFKIGVGGDEYLAALF